ncbi:MAG TPA: hypothetical protein VLA89_11120 [Gemmatimonadales bacterium]|nr:hypothetical protein [Gemmatimonadales bacterium]
MHEIIYKLNTAVIAVVLMAIAVALLAPKSQGTQHHPDPRVCFPAKKWAPAPDGDRPCVYIRLYEDGTFRSQVEQADGDPFRAGAGHGWPR